MGYSKYETGKDKSLEVSFHDIGGESLDAYYSFVDEYSQGEYHRTSFWWYELKELLQKLHDDMPEEYYRIIKHQGSDGT